MRFLDPLVPVVINLARALPYRMRPSPGNQGLCPGCCAVCLLGARLCPDALVPPIQIPDLFVRPTMTERHSQLP